MRERRSAGLEGVEEDRLPPYEDPAVPKVLAARDVLPGARSFGLLGEPGGAVDPLTQLCPAAHVAEVGVRSGGPDAVRDQHRLALRSVEGARAIAGERLEVVDRMIRRQHRKRAPGGDPGAGRGDRRRRVSRHGLAEHDGTRTFAPHSLLEVECGHDQHVVGARHHAHRTLEGGRQQRTPIPCQRQELLGSLGLAPRPEALAAAAGQHEHVALRHGETCRGSRRSRFARRHHGTERPRLSTLHTTRSEGRKRSPELPNHVSSAWSGRIATKIARLSPARVPARRRHASRQLAPK